MVNKKGKARATCPECREPLVYDIICEEDSVVGEEWYYCENCRYWFSEPNFKFMDDVILSDIDDDGEYYVRYTDEMKEAFRVNRMKNRTEGDKDA